MKHISHFIVVRVVPLILCLTIFCYEIHAQHKVVVAFEKTDIRVESGPKKEVKVTVTLSLLEDAALVGTVVTIGVDGTNKSFASNNIFLPNDNSMTVENGVDTIKKSFDVILFRDSVDDKYVTLNLTAKKDGTAQQITQGNTTCRIYVKPIKNDTLNNRSNNQFWCFVGTNIDLLDGVQAQDLYFKGGFLFNIPFDNHTSHSWLYLTFGENRYFNTSDSFSRVGFSDVLVDPKKPDSISIVNGFYNTARKVETQNTYVSLDYLWKVSNNQSKSNQLFVLAETYFALQSITTTYSNYNVISDTNTTYYNKDSGYSFRPLPTKQNILEANYNLGIGFMWVYNTDYINVKSQLISGFNSFDVPTSIVTNGLSEHITYSSQKNTYTQFRLEANVLNPGLSLGFEMFVREHYLPLYNISLSKILDLRQIGSLFKNPS